ncbi:Fic family protein [Brevundimonas sp.]|uniref:Fic family protein n=1 Tax=Brevundimonas sp. TaxID=1871086 RepID=UPI0039C87990
MAISIKSAKSRGRRGQQWVCTQNLEAYNGVLFRLGLRGRQRLTLYRVNGVGSAVVSSRIEGTQATLDEVLEFDAGIESADVRRGDIEEISNYRAAVQGAEDALVDRPLSLALIRAAHQRLMQGVRGRDKEPGAFRTDQNWIGRHGDPIERARFVPPSPLVLQGALENWERFLQAEGEDPPFDNHCFYADR